MTIPDDRHDPATAADVAAALHRCALPAAPLAMPLQSLDATTPGLIPRLYASLAPRAGG
jgi:hypothetical protein